MTDKMKFGEINMEDKDTGIDVENVVSRIRHIQQMRKTEKDRIVTNSKILKSLSNQSTGRSLRNSTCVTKPPTTTMTLDDIKKAADRLPHMELGPIPNMPYNSNGELDAFMWRIPVGYNRGIVNNFSVNSVSMVTIPEPDWAIKDPTVAFDYAMKLVEK